MMTKKHNLEPFLSKPVELAQIADNVLVPKPVLILDVGRTRDEMRSINCVASPVFSWARSTPPPCLVGSWPPVAVSSRDPLARETQEKVSYPAIFSLQG